METFYALLAFCELLRSWGDDYPHKSLVMERFDVRLDNKQFASCQYAIIS